MLCCRMLFEAFLQLHCRLGGWVLFLFAMRGRIGSNLISYLMASCEVRMPCRPVRVVKDPVRSGENDVLVLCMVMNPDNSPHETNERYKLMQQVTDAVKEEECLFGFEQVRCCGRVTCVWYLRADGSDTNLLCLCRPWLSGHNGTQCRR